MIRALRDHGALFAGMLMLMTANGLLVTLLSFRGAAIGLGPTEIGVMQAGYPLGALLGSTLAPRLVERVGHVRAFAALAALCSVAAIVHLATADVASWTAMRILAGFCFPGLYVVAESWLNARAENRSRAVVLSAYFVIQTAGAAAGQALAGLEDPRGTALFGLASILISLSVLPLLLSRGPTPDYAAPERMAVRRLAAISPMAVAGSALNGAAQGAFYIGVPLWGLALGLSPGAASALVVAGTLAGAAVQFPVGWLSDRGDRRLVVAGLAAGGAASALALLAGAFDGAAIVGVALIGATTLPIYSLCVAHANDQLAPSQIVSASGTLVFALNLGILGGAFAGPAAIGLAGPAGLPSLLALLAVLTAAVALRRRASGAPPAETGAAQPISVQGAQTAGRLSPASDRAG